MAVYAKKINSKQRQCMQKYENICGFEFMHQEDIDTGKITFTEAWHDNIRWLEGVLADVTNIDVNGAIT